MRAPGITYAFTSSKDVAGPQFEILSRHDQISASSLILETLITDLPKDKILVLTNVSVAADPGAAQGVVELAIQGVTQAGLNFTIARKLPIGTTGESDELNWDGEVYIQGGGDGATSVRVISVFGTDTNANLSTVGIHGIVIPHGNAGAF